jgi:4-methylaminobutanoate oxidase (formaldehyde-forming)
VVGVRTERGDLECEKVVLAAGLWGRELAAKAGVTVPLQAAEHYYLLTEPIAGVTPESVPVVEEGEAYGYYREEGGGLLVGMFEPVAKAWSLDGTPRDSAFAVLPPDWDRMAPFLDAAMQALRARRRRPAHLLLRPQSFTPDLHPMLGPAPRSTASTSPPGLNSLGILLGGGVGSVVAQWIVDGRAPVDVTHYAVERALPYETTRRSGRAGA